MCFCQAQLELVPEEEKKTTGLMENKLKGGME